MRCHKGKPGLPATRSVRLNKEDVNIRLNCLIYFFYKCNPEFGSANQVKQVFDNGIFRFSFLIRVVKQSNSKAGRLSPGRIGYKDKII